VTTLKTAAADAPAIRTARSRRLMAGSCGCLDDREPVPFQHRPDERTETVIVVHDEDLRTGAIASVSHRAWLIASGLALTPNGASQQTEARLTPMSARLCPT
jgi:hypothetical protein